MNRRSACGAFVVLAVTLSGCAGVDPDDSEPVAALRSALDTGPWVATGEMTNARAVHTATLLPDGGVLVAGSGAGAPSSSTTEIYGPATGEWHAAASLLEGRAWHTATLVDTPAGPQVLVVGGQGGAANDVLATAERYDPVADAWTGAATMSGPRSQHTATRLLDGTVLVTGGGRAETEIYDPATDTWRNAAAMNSSRHRHVAVLLASGRVLVAGDDFPASFDAATAEEYDPTADMWTSVGSLAEGRGAAAATRLHDGMVLITGGFHDMPPFTRRTAERYDPATQSFTGLPPMIEARGEHAAAALPGGLVLLAGGQQVNGGMLASAELYDPATQAFAATSPLTVARALHTLTLLGDGVPLAAGGSNGQALLSSAELYGPSQGSSSSSATSGSASSASGASASSSGQAGVVPLARGCTYVGSGAGAGGIGATLLLLAACGHMRRRPRRSGGHPSAPVAILAEADG